MSFRAFDWLIVLLMRKCMCCIRVCRQSKRGGLKCAVLWETSANLKYMKGNRSFAISERASCCPNGPPAVANFATATIPSDRRASQTSFFNTIHLLGSQDQHHTTGLPTWPKFPWPRKRPRALRSPHHERLDRLIDR